MEIRDAVAENGDTPLHFRQATAADSARLIPLINSAFSIETFLEGTRTDDARLSAMMEEGAILLAEDHTGQLLASVYTEIRAERGYLGMLAVDPAHQRSGVGRQLVEAAEDRFRSLGCVAVDITVLSLRPELPPIYRRFGYIETGTEKFHPTHPQRTDLDCHCIVMSKLL
jgi:predicted N-acetyltransferase YhbS